MTVPRRVTAICKARELLTELRVATPEEIMVERIAPFKGAPIRFANLSGCDGYMIRDGKTAVITVRNTIESIGQKRFVIAHELGHVLLHPDIKQIDQVDQWQTRNFNHNQAPEELEANYFAAELLMPKQFFEADAYKIEPSWHNVRMLAQQYRTTLTSTAIQFVHHSPEPLILAVSFDGHRRWFVMGDKTEGFFIREETYLHKYSCAREVISKGLKESKARVPAGAWLDRFDPNGKAHIMEDALRGREGNVVMSLLWINEDI